METILVGFDGGEAAQRALLRANELAEAVRARLVVVSVAVPAVPPPGVATAVPTAAARFAEAGTSEFERAEGDLDRARELLAERHAGAEFVIEAGDPADRIRAVANERDADLIVVGTREPGFLERLLVGSVSEEVSRSAGRDVLIVH